MTSDILCNINIFLFLYAFIGSFVVEDKYIGVGIEEGIKSAMGISKISKNQRVYYFFYYSGIIALALLFISGIVLFLDILPN